MSDSQTFQLGMFNKHVGEKFKVQLEEIECTLELIEAAGKSGQLEDDSRNFALLFRDPEASVNAYLPQATYPLEHETLGKLHLFLVPIGPGATTRALITKPYLPHPVDAVTAPPTKTFYSTGPTSTRSFANKEFDMSEPFLAEIRIMGFNFPPRGNATCDGQILPINQNQSLYSLLGTTFGGDGRTTFGLPDLRGRVPMSPGDDGGQNVTWGQKGGEERHTLATGEMPAHQHRLMATNTAANGTSPATGNVFANCDVPAYRSASGATLVDMHGQMIQNVGANQSHENMQPYLTLTFVIATQGLFPSRN